MGIKKCFRLQIIRKLDVFLSAGSTCVLGMRSLLAWNGLWTTGLTVLMEGRMDGWMFYFFTSGPRINMYMNRILTVT